MNIRYYGLMGWFLIICMLIYIVMFSGIYKNELKIKCSRFTGIENSTSDPLFCKRMQILLERTCDQITYDLRIIVIVFDRCVSLFRLLNSLNEVVYDGDKIKLEVWIDKSENGHVDEDTVKISQSFSFRHGVYEVIQHPEHVGILGQWISTWIPEQNTSEMAVIFEDDITVSKYFYKYLKNVHKKYDQYLDINGFALQGYQIKHHVNDFSRLKGPNGSHVFLYPLFGTWGFSPKRDNWIHFQKWFISACRNDTLDLYIPNNIVSRWYINAKRNGKHNNLWSMWHVYHAHIYSEVTLFANLPGGLGMTANWRPKGLHYKRNIGKSNKLLLDWKHEFEFENLPTRPTRVNILGEIVN